ncbi:MAG: M28 family peptidase [Flavobacteriales bacterium]
MRALLLASMFVPAVSVIAQDPAVVAANARKYVDALTAPDMHGRGYVSGGDRIAADWIAAQFARIGLRPVKADHFQPFQFNVNSFPDSIHVEVDGALLDPGVDFLVDPSSGTATGDYRLVHLYMEDLATPERRAMTMGVLAGQAACLHFSRTTDADTLAMQARLKKELMHYGPVVVPVDGKLTWGVAQEAMPFPLIEVASPLLTDSARTMRLDVKNRMLLRHEARNVLGMVKGRSKSWLIVSAHYDHLGEMGPDALFPGANDNASGVAMLLSLAEWFNAHPIKHNILFAAFAGEEAGLLGSEWCAVDRPIDLAAVRLMVNLDILGTGDEGITVVNATAVQDHFDRMVKLNNAGGYLPQVKSRGPACNSDHCPFVKRKVPAIFIYTLGGIAAYHDVHDRGDTLPLTKFPAVYALLKELISGTK